MRLLRVTSRSRSILFLLFLSWLGSGGTVLAADSPTSDTAIECGDIVEGEFTQQNEKHVYRIAMKPGEEFSFAFVPVGDLLKIYKVEIYEPAGVRIHEECCGDQHKYHHKSGKLSARGTYSVFLTSRTAGVYTVHLGCELRDGTEIAPGESRRATAEGPSPVGSPSSARHPARPAIPPPEFRGFPGLGPIDFSDIAFPKLQIGIPVEGEITARAGTFGFRFEGERDAEVVLWFQRTAGDLGLALVLLGPSDHLVFQATLADSQSLQSGLLLPMTGEYTLAVANVSLPNRNENGAASFQVEVADRSSSQP